MYAQENIHMCIMGHYIMVIKIINKLVNSPLSALHSAWQTVCSVNVCLCSVAQSCLTLRNHMDVAHQAPLFMELPRQEYWSGLPFPSPCDLPNPRIEPASPMSPELQADSLPLEPSGKPLSKC